ncbi:hypothetical protein UQ28_27865, partial [Escherichia coli]
LINRRPPEMTPKPSSAGSNCYKGQIMGSASFGKKMDALCDGMSRDVKNRTSDTIANLLADKFYQKHIDSDIDIVKLRNDIPDYLMRAIQG